MVVAGAAIQRGPEDAAVTYMVNAGPHRCVAVGVAPSGKGLAFRLDAVGLARRCPRRGHDGAGRRPAGRHRRREVLIGRLGEARAKIAATCKWPLAARATQSKSSDH
jgi:hypothetical protein